MLDAAGLAELDSLPTYLDRPEVIQSIVQWTALAKAVSSALLRLEATWVFKGKIIFEHFSGLAAIQSIDYVWDSTHLSTGITEQPPAVAPTGPMGRLSEASKELESLLERVQYEALAPSGGGVMGIGGLRGVRFVPLSGSEIARMSGVSGVSAAVTGAAVTEAGVANAVAGADAEVGDLKQSLAHQLFSGFAAGAEGEATAEMGGEVGRDEESNVSLTSAATAAAPAPATAPASADDMAMSLELPDGLELYIEMDEEGGLEGLFGGGLGLDLGLTGASAVSAESTAFMSTGSDESVDSVSAGAGAAALTPALLMLQSHVGAAYRMIDARRDQAQRDGAAAEARIAQLREKVGLGQAAK
jgi:hypothetical protein